MADRYRAVEVKINPTGLGGSSGYLYTQLIDGDKPIGRFDSYHEAFKIAKVMNESLEKKVDA